MSLGYPRHLPRLENFQERNLDSSAEVLQSSADPGAVPNKADSQCSMVACTGNRGSSRSHHNRCHQDVLDDEGKEEEGEGDQEDRGEGICIAIRVIIL